MATAPGRGNEETCERHADQKLQHYCKTCKALVCHTCVSRDHKDHNSVNTAEVSAASKSQMETAFVQMEELVSTVQQGVSAVKGELGALGAKKTTALEEMDKAFDLLESSLRQRRQAARADLQSRVEQDRLRLEKDLASQESLLSAAQASLHWGRRVVQQGTHNDLAVGADWVQATLKDLGTRAEEAVVVPIDYQVKTKDLPLVTQAMSSYGDVSCGHNDNTPRLPEQTKPKMTSLVSTVHAGYTDEEISNEPECGWSCPTLQFDVKCCGPNCSVDDGCTTLVNGVNKNELPRPGAYRFYGTCSTRPLTGTSYFEVRATSTPKDTIPENIPWCEVGVAGKDVLRSQKQRRSIADCSSQAAVTVAFSKRNAQVGAFLRCKGEWVEKVEVSQFDPHFNEVHIGILWDSTHRRVFFIHVPKATEMFHMDIETTEPLFCVSRMVSMTDCRAEVKVELVTGDHIESPGKRRLIHDLLQQSSA